MAAGKHFCLLIPPILTRRGMGAIILQRKAAVWPMSYSGIEMDLLCNIAYPKMHLGRGI